MPWLEQALDQLDRSRTWGYHHDQHTASEPTALVALALSAHGLILRANRPLDWMAQRQADDGSIGVTADQSTPGWPTSLAVVAWRKADEDSGRDAHRNLIERGAKWLLGVAGKPLDQQDDMGHDTTLVGWPWVEGTHSWLEPTAFAVLALKAAGYGNHARTREAVKLIIDRQLPDGGCNYGNTFVLGQCLRPHVQPSGIALLALAGEQDTTGRLQKTIDYLLATVSGETTTASLGFALLGLGAVGQTPSQAEAWLDVAAARTFKRDVSPYKLALLALAQCADKRPFQTKS